ncbi:phosphatase PAP2 family protein [Ligilactobacillus acidipiscis]|jgi:membrane-associated phospholipid phosphatase|uniref:phosphatase PAP2 family protein n=1 Tax=Ligilactobacillus acidipiscis TaxID=89059 RepID=UPI002FD9CFF7
MSFSQQKKLFSISTVICVVLLVIAAFGDLWISNTVINYRSVFGTVFQSVGEFPQYLIFVISGQIALTFAFKIQGSVLFKCLLGSGGLAVSGWQLKQYLNEVESYFLSVSSNLDHHKPIGLANSDNAAAALSVGKAYWIWLLIFVILTVAFQYWLGHFQLETIQRLLLVAVFASLTVWFSLQVNQGLKEIWGRVRPYELNKTQSNFTNWLTINGVTGHKSFPSGHTQAATLLIVFSWFFKGKTQKVWWISGIVYGALMGLSRVVIGAHFMSDVVFSFFLTAVIIYIFRQLYYQYADEKQSKEMK